MMPKCWRLAAVAAAILVSTAVMPSHAQPKDARDQTAQAPAVLPFKAHIPDEVLVELRRRLAQTKWPDQLPGTTWEHGADIGTMRKLAEYWEKKYDWRAQEARINRLEQFTTEIDGQRIHFIHQRSPRGDAIPLLLLHGWPGSIVEFLTLIEPLTNPKDSNTPAFHVIIPSLPGFGFSGPAKSPGWDTRRMAKAFVVLKTPTPAEDIMAFVAERVAPHKKIRKLQFIDAIPKSASGKILRRVLVEQERAKAP